MSDQRIHLDDSSGGAPNVYNPNAELSNGVTLIEASAGTGKTYQIVHLVTRIVAERDVPIEQILVVTFTKAATAELIERLRSRLALARDRLSGVGETTKDATLEAWVASISDRGAAVKRLRGALNDFDQAPINTIHGFCQRMLSLHAFESNTEYDVELVKSSADAQAEVTDDFLTFEGMDADEARWTALGGTSKDPPGRDQWKTLARLAMEDPKAQVSPPLSGTDPFVELSESAFELITLQFNSAWGRVAEVLEADGGAICEALSALFPTASGSHTYAAKKNAGRVEDLRNIALGTDPKGERFADRVTVKAFRLKEIQGRFSDGSVPGGHHIDSLDAVFPCLSRIDEALAATVAPSKRFPTMQKEAAAREAGASPKLLLQTRFVQIVRDAVPATLRGRRQRTYQDLLESLNDALHPDSPQHVLLRESIRARFSVALVDEFQDTDRVQWGIFDRVFAQSDRHALYLIGDPKQAIYAFRGANIHVYFSAVKAAAQRFTLTTNYRSSGRLVQAFNRVFTTPGRFLSPDLRYPDNRGLEKTQQLKVSDGFLSDAPFHVRFVDTSAISAPASDALRETSDFGGSLAKTKWPPHFPGIVAQDIVSLLERRPQILPSDSKDPARPLTAGDIAVLVSTHWEAADIAYALGERGVASVRANSGSVFESDAFKEVCAWLAVVANPTDQKALRRLTASELVGWSDATRGALRRALAPIAAPDKSEATEDAGDDPPATCTDKEELARREAALDGWRQLGASAQRWARTFEKSGVLAAWRKTLNDLSSYAESEDVDRLGGTEARLLADDDGDRLLTDLRHLTELLHETDIRERIGARGLLRWLRSAASDKSGEHPRRLERESAAVKIVTMHACKGLEYPVAFAPYLWTFQGGDAPRLLPVPSRPEDRALALALDTAGREYAAREELAERMRLLYVAFTRARLGLVTYSVAAHSSCLARSALGLALHAGDPPEEVALDPQALVEHTRQRIDDALGLGAEGCQGLYEDLLALSASSAGENGPAIGCSRVPYRELSPLRLTEEAPPSMTVRAFARRKLDRRWGLISYSWLTRGKDVAVDRALPETLALDHDEALDEFDLFPESATAAPAPRASVLEAATSGTVAKDPPEEPPPLPSPTMLPFPPEELPVPLADFPSGANAGTALHAIYEHLDFALAEAARGGLPDPTDGVDARDKVRALVATQLRRHGFGNPELVDPAVDGLLATLDTPLGGPLPDFRLADLRLPPDHGALDPDACYRFDELRFDFPLAGGMHYRYAAHEAIRSEAIAAAFASLAEGKIEEPRERMRPIYAARLAAMGSKFGTLVGRFTGYIDLVFRAPVNGAMRYFVADYKSNRIAVPEPPPEGRPPTTPSCYQPGTMRREMERHNYHVQAAIYTVALHRYLRWRVPNYDYDLHMGGAYYLFVRGMIGPQTPSLGDHRYGVWFERPPRELIEALDAALYCAPRPRAEPLSAAAPPETAEAPR